MATEKDFDAGRDAAHSQTQEAQHSKVVKRCSARMQTCKVFMVSVHSGSSPHNNHLFSALLSCLKCTKREKENKKTLTHVNRDEMIDKGGQETKPFPLSILVVGI